MFFNTNIVQLQMLCNILNIAKQTIWFIFIFIFF